MVVSDLILSRGEGLSAGVVLAARVLGHGVRGQKAPATARRRLALCPAALRPEQHGALVQEQKLASLLYTGNSLFIILRIY